MTAIGGVGLINNTPSDCAIKGTGTDKEAATESSIHDEERGYTIRPVAHIGPPSLASRCSTPHGFGFLAPGVKELTTVVGSLLSSTELTPTPRRFEMTTQMQVQQVQPQQQSQAQSQSDRQDDKKITVVVKPRKARPVLIPVHL